jgi:hypothetical protein
MSGGSTQKQTSNQTTSTTTALPTWLTDAGQQVAGKALSTAPVGAYGGQLTAGTTANQNAASSAAAANAGAWQPDLAAARGMATAAAGAPAASVGNYQTGTALAGAARAGTTMAGAARAGTTMAGAATAGPATVASAPQQQSYGYTAATAAGGGAPSVSATNVNGSTFDSAAAAKYMNPFSGAVTADTLKQMDLSNQSDRQALDDNIQAAGAFGGTRQAVEDAQLTKDQATARTNYIDSSNQAAYQNAQGQFNTDRSANDALAVGNADRGLQAQTTNATLLDNLLGRQDQASQFTAGAANTAAGANADRTQAVNLANAGYQQDASEANAGRQQQTNLANAGAENATSEANAGRAQQTGLANANAANATSEANAGRQQQTGLANQDARNTTATGNANRALTSDTTNASEYDTMLNRLLSGSNALSGVAQTGSQLGTQDIANLSATGGVDQATQQAADDAAYQEYLRAGNAPLDNYKDIMAILAGAPRNVTTNGTSSGTSTTKTDAGLLNTLLGAAQIGVSAAGKFSDRRLKTDVLQIRTAPNGLGVYRYRYVWDAPDAPFHTGVMADEVEKIAPHALGPTIQGYRTVNYDQLQGVL